ncbi:putative lysine methyltransferase, S-adenosyl-L-methionine-dependent methyltransferase [Helianthus annuus]|uniref:Lysine methyltransferase, S-adenosyl-L-methionine-dependent methyltransferase n=1 Tax=Helianthus annuus TaxID=4232 RepID=A0A9K3MX42_HELAN|nr:putative lysine methyltransferase, S-adenosyl-L-methionine-dependent methyltransferase [Helianthus annuus]KAJ0863772.1 putative lysine methyltransferase, S-adenosyl-L-methionine-dependent methyltransferase [Helianthus annuus]
MSENELLKPDAIESDDDDTVCLGESFFIDNNYELATFTFGSHVLHLLCLQSASTDFDLTGQLVWPGARLLNQYISNNVELLQGSSALELGSGVGVTGILCSRFCHKVVLTDHNDEILNKNIELHKSSEDSNSCAALSAEKLEWGNSDQLDHILQKHPEGFDLILGADIYILFILSFKRSLFRVHAWFQKTVEACASRRETVKKRF